MEIDENPPNIHIPRLEGFAGVEKPLGGGYEPGKGNNPAAVSYTHLTLPTNREV